MALSPRAPLPLAAAALLLAGAATASEPPVLRCGTGIHAAEATGLVLLPQGDLFCPPLADPKAPRSFVSYLRGEFPAVTGAKSVGAIGIADSLGLLRYGGPNPGDGIQLGIEAGVFAQFDLGAPSDDLINADYVVGLPLAFRLGGFSAQARLYHQSSHLGDELLGRRTIQNDGLSLESAELILSQEIRGFRVFVGGEYVFRRTPSDIEPFVIHSGAELRLGPARGARLVAAVDMKSTEQQDWDPAWSARAGVEIARWSSPDHPPRLLSLLGEFYDGPSPYGQFFLEDTRFYGVGFHFLL